MKSLPLVLLLALLALVAGRALIVCPDLPATIASHFDGSGKADGWSSKGAFLAIAMGVLALVAAVSVGLPSWLARLPVAWINLPRRDYWLAPEHVAETRARIRTFMTWYGILTAAFVGWVLELTYRANLAPNLSIGAGAADEVRLSGHMWTALAAYLVAVVAWLVLFVRCFHRVPAGPHLAAIAARK
jgi:uncharacterized membrane protein